MTRLLSSWMSYLSDWWILVHNFCHFPSFSFEGQWVDVIFNSATRNTPFSLPRSEWRQQEDNEFRLSDGQYGKWTWQATGTCTAKSSCTTASICERIAATDNTWWSVSWLVLILACINFKTPSFEHLFHRREDKILSELRKIPLFASASLIFYPIPTLQQSGLCLFACLSLCMPSLLYRISTPPAVFHLVT